MKNPEDSLEKVANSTFAVKVHHKGQDHPVKIEINNYTYADVFDAILERYNHDLDYIDKLTIEVVR